MRFEKLNDNKIRITITNKDLEEKHIDTHSFMSNPIESQTLFLDMLNEAEKEIGFITKNYNLKIEALQVSGGDFIITVTRTLPDNSSNIQAPSSSRKKVHVKRKNISLNENNAIFMFNSFDDFLSFSDALHISNIDINHIAKNISLYEYNKDLYLVISNINLKYSEIKRVFSTITEFATYVNNSDLFKRNLVEKGKVIIKNNAINTVIKYFY